MQPEWSKPDIRMYRTERKRKGVYKYAEYRNADGRLVNTRAYAIAWGVINKPYSQVQLMRMCGEDPDAPSFNFIVRRCWQGYPRYYDDLVKAGMPPRPPRTEDERRRLLAKAERDSFSHALLDKDYDVARMAAQYGVKSQAEYNRLRREKPETKAFLPADRTVVKRYGTWRRFQYEVLKYNADIVLTQYVSGSAAAGHWLRMRECDEQGIPIRGLMDLLRPSLFNVLCYRKLKSMGLADSIPPPVKGE